MQLILSESEILMVLNSGVGRVVNDNYRAFSFEEETDDTYNPTGRFIVTLQEKQIVVNSPVHK